MTGAVRNPRWSLRQKLAQVLVLTALLPAVLFGAALLWNQWQRDHDDLVLRLGSNAQLAANAVGEFLQGEMAGVELLADGDAMQGQGWEQEQQLDRLLAAYPAMLRALITDAHGRIVVARGMHGRLVPHGEAIAADRDWFRVPRDSGKAHVSNSYRARIYGDEALVAVSAPLFDDGRFAGVLQASIPVERFTSLRSRNLRYRGFELLLLDRANRVIHASQGLRWGFMDDAGAVGVQIRREADALGQPGAARIVEGVLRDHDRAYLNAVAMRNGWVVAVVAPLKWLEAPAWPRLLLVLGLFAVSALGVLWALWQQRRLVRDNIDYLSASLRGYALGGKLDPAQVGGMPEELQPLADGIGDLGRRMNAAYGELQDVLDQRERVIAERTSELRKAVSDLDRLSRTDALTGGLNYRGFVEAGERLFREARTNSSTLSVLALDIDHFKRYNDLYGHAQGDGALRRFAGAVRSALLHADDVLARPGGEEFTVFLPGSTREQAMQVASRICQRVRDADIAHAASPKGRMTVSVGLATLDAADIDIEDVLKRADAALYRVKAGGRDGASD